MTSLKTSDGWLAVLWSMVGLARVILALDFSEVTSFVGLGLSRGSVSALADFNGDRLTDILIVNDTGTNMHHTLRVDQCSTERCINSVCVCVRHCHCHRLLNCCQ